MKLGPKEIKVVNEYFVRPVKNRLKEIFMKKGLPQLRTADEIKQPPVRKDVEDIQAINEFNKRNPRADGGMLVKPSDDGSRPGYAGVAGAQDSGIPPRKTFEKEYKKFKGSDREFAEFLNKKYKTKRNTTSSVENKRRRLGIKTVNPKATGDYKGLEKYIKNFKGKFRPGLFEIANRFGFKDKGVVEKMISRVNPDMKKATPPGRLPPGVESKEAKAKREIEERKKIKKEKAKQSITEKQFKEEYKKFKPVDTGSDVEFANYLNKKKYKDRGESFSSRRVNQIRRDLGIESKMITTRVPKLSDEFILQEADRMKLNVDRSNPKKLRQAVIQAISRERNLTPDEKQKLYDARIKSTVPKLERQFPYNIGKKPEPKALFWRDLLDNAQRHQGFLLNRSGAKLPESHIKFKNPDQVRPTDIKSAFDIELIDTNVVDKKGNPKVLTYDNFLKHVDDNQKLYNIDSKTALAEYKKKRFIQENKDLRDKFNLKVNKSYDPTSATSRAVFSPMHIHHTAGRGRNAFNVQFAVASENMQENALRTTLNRKFKDAKTFGEQRTAVKEYLDKVPPTLEVRLKNTPYGQRETLIDMTKRIAPELTKDVKRAGGVQLGANPFLSPGFLGRAFSTIPTPAGAVALTAGFGVDPTSAIDRASIAAEAAFAPQLVKQAAKMGSAQRFFNLGLSPAMAARAARIASPIGIASLAAEGLYQGGKFTKKRIEELRSMTPEQRAELRRQGEAQAFDPFQAAGGGIAKLAGDRSGAMLTSMNPDKDGLPGLLKRGKK
jgi:hypothetical protein